MTDGQEMSRSRRNQGPLLRFSKMHGLGNDFVVVDAISQPFRLRPDMIRELADRNVGIGFDQLLVVEPPGQPDVDFRYRIFSANGSEVAQCENGAWCFARFVRDQRLTNKQTMRVETARGVVELNLLQNGIVAVNMGVPELNPPAIPFAAEHRKHVYTVETGTETVQLSAVSMDSPHAVIVVDDVDAAPVADLGSRLENHPRFPSRATVGFLQIINRTRVRLRVHERGTGETLACGSGACAAVVAGCLRGLLDSRVVVEVQGGRLVIEWQGEGAPVMMEGPATSVFEGQLRLPGDSGSSRRRKPGRPHKQRI